ncbi:MAG: Trk family potassium uptake protein, partial [Clostridia bacterium]|nr:Trk family potassium uptake protein [Clostridia bacterium]
MLKNFFRKLSPSAIFIAGFFIIIILGAVLLSLPVSSASGEVTPFFDSLFTAVSSTCITGLVVYDTFTHWSFFGQVVLILLIQIGGLGFMTVATAFTLVFHKNVGHKERMMLVQTFNLNDMSGVVRLFKHIVIGTFSFEGAAAVILAFRFIPDYGLSGGIWRGIFIAISAFCNAGFDLMGTPEGPFASLTAYADDLVVNLTLCFLIAVGGLCFLVWEVIFSGKSFKKMSVQSKIVIIFSASLIIIGALAIFLFEFDNPETLGVLSPKGKILAALFQSVSPRTAGFNTVDLAALTEGSQIIMIILMFIGGSSGSTAGG